MKFYCLIRFQYLGFRYHGWLKQSSKRTVQETIEEAVEQVLQTEDFQILGASRTDSMVSANESFFELITNNEIMDLISFSEELNRSLPPDIKILEAKKVGKDFKIISSARMKEYHYYFSFGKKLHPFCAPFMAMINENMDIESMKIAARLFEGEHDFSFFCHKKKEGQNFIRTIDLSTIETNTELHGSFFPAKSFVFKIRAKSFLRHQVRLMMGAIFQVGMGKLSLDELKEMLRGESSKKVMTAPASGLILQKISWE